MTKKMNETKNSTVLLFLMTYGSIYEIETNKEGEELFWFVQGMKKSPLGKYIKEIR